MIDILKALLFLAALGYLLPAVILEGYMWRWHLIPRNKRFNIYLHVFVGDDDRTAHDHPWVSWSLCLWGRMTEYSQVRLTPRQLGLAGRPLSTAPRHATKSSEVRSLTYTRRGLGCKHRLRLRSRFAVTVFCTGALQNGGAWYFHPAGQTRVPYWDWPQSFKAKRWSWLNLRYMES